MYVCANDENPLRQGKSAGRDALTREAKAHRRGDERNAQR
jgi:hypothetical protein